MTHKILVALPNMGVINAYILSKLSYWSTWDGYRFSMAPQIETIFHDNARNKLCEEFLKTDCDWMLMLDSDIDPHPYLPRMVDHGKPIIAGNVLAWIKGEMCSSIWDKSACEECKTVKLWQELGQVRDPREYCFDADLPSVLLRWNPFRESYESLLDREDGRFDANSCRCGGTGVDPFVYKVSQKIMKKEAPIQVDAVGAAALMIHRGAIESLPRPWFRFLYRESREIMMTEDMYFCHKARERGFEIWADQTMACGHYKRINLLDLNNWAGSLYHKGSDDAVKRLEEMIAEREKRIIVPAFEQ